LDPWLLGWFAVAAYGAFTVLDVLGVRVGTSSWILWAAGAASAAHFVMTYRFAYGNPRLAIRRHPVALVVVPSGLIALAATSMWQTSSGHDQMLRSLLGVVYLLTMWHYIRQSYGVARISARLREFTISRPETVALKLGLYPMCVISIVSYLRERSIVAPVELNARVDLIPEVSAGFRVGLTAALSVVLIGAFTSMWRRERRRPPASVIAPIAAATLWIGLTPTLLAAVVLLPAFHAIQYLACCWPLERASLGALGLSHVNRHIAAAIAAAAAVGLLATRTLPRLLNSVVGVDQDGTVWLIAVFTVLNLHHFAIDAVIWRSRGHMVATLLSEGSRPVAPTSLLG
jgi:hypothetical protein